jgi:hypothetical protein
VAAAASPALPACPTLTRCGWPYARPSQLALAAAPPGERAWTEPAAGLAGPAGQARDPQPGPHTGQTGGLSPSGGPSQCGQHCHARWERGHHRGGHRPGPQPQQAQAQAHQRQHRHVGTATRRRGAAPARSTIGVPSGGAHATDGTPAILGPLVGVTPPGPGVMAIGWAATRPGGLAATECRAGPARPACGPLPPPAVVHPETRTTTVPSSAPTRRDRARAGQAVIASSRHGSSAAPFDAPPAGQVPPCVLCRPASSAWC